MIGLMVLGGILIYLIIAVALSFLSTKLVKKRKFAVWVLVLVVMLLIPTWDIIPGRYHFNKLCEKDAGLHVYDTAKIDGLYIEYGGSGVAMDYLKMGFKYVETEGYAKKLYKFYLSDTGELKKKKIDKPSSRFHYLRNRIEDKILNSKKIEHRIQDIETSNILAVYRMYGYFGGWVEEKVSQYSQGGALYCPPNFQGMNEFRNTVLTPNTVDN